MPKLQAGCTLTAQDGMVVKHGADAREGGGGPERDARVHPRQPSARLPRLRQGRRVPAAGPDVPLRARQHAHELREADLREADSDLADDRARPRALHPLLPLHALQRDGQRGRSARGEEPRRDVGDHDVRRRAVPERVQRQRHRALPGRRAAADAVPAQGASVGDQRGADGVRHVPRRVQHVGRRARGQGAARSLAQPCADRRGLALRQGPVRVHPSAFGRPRRRPDSPRAPARLRAGDVERRARPRGADAAQRAGPRRRRALRLRDGRARVRARAARPRGHRLARRDAARGSLRRARRVPRAALLDRRREARRRARRRAARAERADRRPLGEEGPAQRRRPSSPPRTSSKAPTC